MLTESANVIPPADARHGLKNQSPIFNIKIYIIPLFSLPFGDQLKHTFHVKSIGGYVLGGVSRSECRKKSQYEN